MLYGDSNYNKRLHTHVCKIYHYGLWKCSHFPLSRVHALSPSRFAKCNIKASHHLKMLNSIVRWSKWSCPSLVACHRWEAHFKSKWIRGSQKLHWLTLITVSVLERKSSAAFFTVFFEKMRRKKFPLRIFRHMQAKSWNDLKSSSKKISKSRASLAVQTSSDTNFFFPATRSVQPLSCSKFSSGWKKRHEKWYLGTQNFHKWYIKYTFTVITLEPRSLCLATMSCQCGSFLISTPTETQNFA
jgi:hypothetical protein